jgi:hypothetical protein
VVPLTGFLEFCLLVCLFFLAWILDGSGRRHTGVV